MPDLRKRKGLRRRRPAPRPVPPNGIALRYYSALKGMLAIAHALVADRLLPRLPEWLDRSPFHQDAQAPGKRVNTVIEQIRAAYDRKFPQKKLEDLAAKITKAASEHQKEQLFRQVRTMLGVDLKAVADRGLTPRVKHFVSENVALIKTLPEKYFSEVEGAVLGGMRAGARSTEIETDIEERLGIAEGRAKLIARDQILKFNGELNELRQQALGIETYVWRTVEDNRVRSVHAERDGKVYSWDDPPGDPTDPATGGHPGSAINCRCWSDPNVDNLLAEEDTE